MSVLGFQGILKARSRVKNPLETSSGRCVSIGVSTDISQGHAWSPEGKNKSRVRPEPNESPGTLPQALGANAARLFPDWQEPEGNDTEPDKAFVQGRTHCSECSGGKQQGSFGTTGSLLSQRTLRHRDPLWIRCASGRIR